MILYSSNGYRYYIASSSQKKYLKHLEGFCNTEITNPESILTY